MTCYQRNGYRYESGGYVKPELPQKNEPPETESLTVVAMEEKEQNNQPNFGDRALSLALGAFMADVVSEGIKSAGYTSQDSKKLLEQLTSWLRHIEQNHQQLSVNQQQIFDALQALRSELRKEHYSRTSNLNPP